ncbi:hypothetical protein ABEB36_007322 [Hypothenemus hampei]|uniref:LEM domain-containing protein n=1 Tax=Hypothenemus hampei TaxID=57062 RepID=A0ABD1EU36_HYPHA
MIDVEKLSDAELRTKLLEFGFPVMPITGTTRKVMVKKLKLLLENKNKVGSSDTRRSLGKYSSEEESDNETKSRRMRRITLAAPVASTSVKINQKIVEPEPVSSPKGKQTSASKTKIIRGVQDDFDTGSESESELVGSSEKLNSNVRRSPSKYDESLEDRDFKRRSPLKTSLSSSYSRYSPTKNDDSSFLNSRNVSFATSSPARHTNYGGTESAGSGLLSTSLASEYANDRLNQMRSRLSLGNPSTPLVSPEVKLTERDTPFLSNFTRRLSALSASKKNVDFENKNDLVKEHDANGSTLYGRSYLSNFRATRGREPTYEYKSLQNEGGAKGSFVSYGVLALAAAFFIVLAVVYLGMVSDTSVVTSGYLSPICDDSLNIAGINCVNKEHIQNAINLLESIHPELKKRAVAHRCFDLSIKPQMTETEIVAFCQTNYGIKDAEMIRKDLHNLEVMTFVNPEWGLHVAQMEKNDGAVTEANILTSMEGMVPNKITSLVLLNPELPYKCVFFAYLANAIYSLTLIGVIFAALFVSRLGLKYYARYQQKQKHELNTLIEKIIEVLQNAASDQDNTYVVINHVRDAILSVKERKEKRRLWERAVDYIKEHESRVRTEVQTVHGESYDVWRWIGSGNLSLCGNSPRKSVWQGQAFDTDPGAANSVAFSPTPCLKIRGMFEEGAGKPVAMTVREAVLSKIGHQCRILHCQAEVSSGVVYLKCASEEDAAIAFKNLHGWWYSGQLVTVKYLRLERYQQRYPDAASGPPYLRSG